MEALCETHAIQRRLMAPGHPKKATAAKKDVNEDKLQRRRR